MSFDVSTSINKLERSPTEHSISTSKLKSASPSVQSDLQFLAMTKSGMLLWEKVKALGTSAFPGKM